MAESTLYLYRISWEDGGEYGTYDSAVVVAESEDAARHTNPCDEATWGEVGWVYDACTDTPYLDLSWGQPNQVTVQLLGLSYLKEPGVVVASFNAG